MTRNVPLALFADVDLILPGNGSGVSAELLAIAARADVPVVFCSGRTRAELEHVSQELGIRQPFVSENGGGVFIPRGYFGFAVPGAHQAAGHDVVDFGLPYSEIVTILRRTAERLGTGIVGFADMSVEEVSRDCGVSMMRARLAKLREYDEPFRFLEPDVTGRRRLFKALHAARIGCTYAGRHHHANAALDKGAAVGFLIALFRRAFGSVLTVGLGEGLTDVPLLRRVDVPLVALKDDRGVARLLAAVHARGVSVAAGAGLSDAVVALIEQSSIRGATIGR